MIPLPDGSCADSVCLCPLSLLSYGHVLFFPKHIRETAVSLRISAGLSCHRSNMCYRLAAVTGRMVYISFSLYSIV